MQAAFGKDAGTLSDEVTELARVMSGKYGWKPGQSVRSVGDVFDLTVNENGMFVGMLSGAPDTGAQPVHITEPAKLQEALRLLTSLCQDRLRDFSPTTCRRR
jgi:hypothetical protein